MVNLQNRLTGSTPRLSYIERSPALLISQERSRSIHSIFSSLKACLCFASLFVKITFKVEIGSSNSFKTYLQSNSSLDGSFELRIASLCYQLSIKMSFSPDYFSIALQAEDFMSKGNKCLILSSCSLDTVFIQPFK